MKVLHTPFAMRFGTAKTTSHDVKTIVETDKIRQCMTKQGATLDEITEMLSGAAGLQTRIRAHQGRYPKLVMTAENGRVVARVWPIDNLTEEYCVGGLCYRRQSWGVDFDETPTDFIRRVAQAAFLSET